MAARSCSASAAETLQLHPGQAYAHWVKRYIIQPGRRHPKDMRKQEGEAFLTSLAAERDVRAATQGQALSAIPFTGRCWSTSCHGSMRRRGRSGRRAGLR
ncbi:phage integrase N-terminal SAM-like domain-containing protein [Aromatoleum bremense]|uniref:Integrase SAM-like N-terminal domain-containing protein n=1 Tax=Aromatoleum bremense TaxID=76115 RepID=A0ABX1NWM7_9RHOO|nr:hypothetical protein [Aromatoleum bremense]